MRKTALIVPCYNEEERLNPPLFRAFSAAETEVIFYFVDDGSTDGTLPILKTLQASNPDVFQLLVLPKNVGKAEAVRQGIQAALSAEPGYVGYWDADLATPLTELPRFRDVLVQHPEVDLVYGARVKLLGRHIKRNEQRHYLGRIFATAVSTMLRVGIYDSQCGAKLFRVTPVLQRLFEEPFSTTWFFDVEILARYMRLRDDCPSLRPVEEVVYELPLRQWVDVAGSKVDFSVYFRTGGDLLRILRRYKLYR